MREPPLQLGGAGRFEPPTAGTTTRPEPVVAAPLRFLGSPEMDATKMRPRPFGEPVQTRASATTGAPSERANCSHLRRERARHGEARKADDGSRTRDLRLGNQR